MSASAGKVMPRPMGDYNAVTEYKILDIVTYNDKPYMAKQTTQGNLPTNTTYWMLLLDFPTEVDNVPTQNSNNLVKSGGVYSATADKMKIDGSNATNITIGQDYASVSNISVEKPAGANQTVTISKTYLSDYIADAYWLETFLKSHIGDDKVTVYFSSLQLALVIDAVSRSNLTVTATAHMIDDTSSAISQSSLRFYNYVKSGEEGTAINGEGNGAAGSGVLAAGSANGSIGDNSLVAGFECTASADYAIAMGSKSTASYGSAAIGLDNQATGSYALALGIGCQASGNYSVALGRGKATASGAMALGQTTAQADQITMGYHNSNKSNTVLEVGAGTSNTPKNAFEVYRDGYVSQNNGTDKYKFAKDGGIDGYYDTNQDFHPFTGYREFVNNSVTLSTSADTTVTFSDASITADSTIEPFTDTWGINPSNVVASAGSCTLTFKKVSTAATIKVKIRVS